jgi:hypothetical protein
MSAHWFWPAADEFLKHVGGWFVQLHVVHGYQAFEWVGAEAAIDFYELLVRSQRQQVYCKHRVGRIIVAHQAGVELVHEGQVLSTWLGRDAQVQTRRTCDVQIWEVLEGADHA